MPAVQFSTGILNVEFENLEK